MISFHALFLSFPPSRNDSPVSVRFRGIRFSTIDLDLTWLKPPVSDGLRRILGDDGRDEEGEVPKRWVEDEPDVDLGDAGDITMEVAGVLGDDEDTRSCSWMRCIYSLIRP